MNKLIVRNISLFLFLAAILALVIVIRGRTPFGKSQSSFAVEPQKEITGIGFIQGDKRLMLSRQKGTWLVNGKHEARKSGIEFITRLLTEIRIKSPVSPDLFRTEITERKIVPVKVRVYDRARVIKSFLVYKTGSNRYGNIMKIREGSVPFIVYVPGFEGDIGSGFILNELFWQPYTVFNLLPSEISSVTFENFADTASSFEIMNKCNKYTLSDTHYQLAGWDTVQVRRYISYFTWIPFESWALDIPDSAKARIETGKPLFRIKVTGTGGTGTTLTLWARIDDKTGKPDTDRLWGKTSDRDMLFVMRYFDIDPVLKKKAYFFAQ